MEQLLAAQMVASGNSSCSDMGHSNVYIRGLPIDVDESLLLGLFQKWGPVESIRIFRSNQNCNKMPYAFVKLRSVDKAEAAISSMNGVNLGGNIVELRLADHDAETSGRSPPPSDNVYCKNLPAGFGDSELKQLFSLFGEVIICRVLHQGDATGQGGAALVRFGSTADAARAVQGLQGHRVLGSLHPLTVRFADSEDIKAKKQAKQVTAALSAMSQQDAVTAMPTYSPYSFLGVGSLSHPGFHSPSPSVSLGTPRGAGIGGAVPQDLCMGQDFTLPAHLIGIPSNPPNNRVFVPPGPPGNGILGVSASVVASLYVKNLPPTSGKLFLYEHFSPFGPILSVKILTDELGNGKGVGFVNFSDAACATKAMVALHNLPLGDRNLHVTFQTHKRTWAS